MLCPGERHIRLQINGQIDGIDETPGGDLSIAHEETQRRRQCECEPNDQQRQGAAERIARQPAEGSEKSLRVARAMSGEAHCGHLAAVRCRIVWLIGG